MKIKGFIFFFLVFGIILTTNTSYAQWHPSSLLDCSTKKWTVG